MARSTSTTVSSFLLLLSSSLLSIALGAEIRITNAQGLIELSNAVSSGTDYSGTTVLLDSDIDFSGGYSERFTPIGNDNNYFLGTFDGQGHTIRNLKMDSSSVYTGLFGYSDGSTIQNVVIDGSCSFVSSLTSQGINPFVGSILGHCLSSNGPCNIESVVNMGSVSFEGDVTVNIWIGGIFGYIYSLNHPNTLKNCVNYGSVTHSGVCSGNYAYIGGIVGIIYGKSASYVSIQNCLNYGTIASSGTSATLAIGGIAGDSQYTIFDNCVSSGAISINQESKNIGGIVGRVSGYSEVTNCYSSSAINRNIIGDISSSALIINNHIFDKASFELDSPVTIGNTTTSSLISALNAAADHYILREYSHWLLNKDSKEVSFTINGSPMSTTMDSEIILLPTPASRGAVCFTGWYTDSGCTSPLTDYEVSNDLMLYGKSVEDSNSYTITFETRGGSPVEPISQAFGTVAALNRSLTRDYCEFLGWENEYGDSVPYDFPVPRRDITLYASWLCTRIATANELISFSRTVNSGRDFTDTTVFLDSDIDFAGGYSERFVPIGYNSVNYFKGTFDGQGHTIRNLKVNSSSQSVGLFGNSQGSAIQNVVIDGSCSFGSSYSSGSLYIGSVLGECRSTNGLCIIESVVNMGSVVFEGNVDDIMFIGGISGYISSSNYPITLKNCVNYGHVTHSGEDGNLVEMGGIVGTSYGQSTSYTYIQNCLNYGTITHNGVSSSVYIGGIAGNSQYTTFENCVSSGAISSNQENKYIGGILGGITTDTNITHCFWTSDAGNVNVYGYTYTTVDVTGSSLATLNQATLDKLNRYITEEKKGSTWSKWVMLHMNGGRINNISQENLVEIQKHFPEPVREGNRFLFWCKDAVCAEVFDPETDDVSTLYAGWEINTVTLDLGNGTVLSEVFTFNTPIVYPKGMVREGYTFSGWDNEPDLMPPWDITIKAQWVINNYAVTFDLRNGTVLNEVFSFNTSIEYPKGMMREGYTFNGWDSMPDLMPARDITIKAQWVIDGYTVTFDLGNGTVLNEVFSFNTPIEYPKGMAREGYTFNGWDSKPELMPAVDITIKALWTPNNYTVMFDVNGGDELPTPTKAVTFNTPYGELPTPSKTGFTFLGWFNDKNESVTGSTIVNTPSDHTLHAKWKETKPGYVEVVFGRKDMSEEEIKTIIKQYTDTEEFTIIRIEDYGSGETRAIIKFVDEEKATEFVKDANEDKDKGSLIKIARITIEYDNSFSSSLKIFSLFSLTFITTVFLPF